MSHRCTLLGSESKRYSARDGAIFFFNCAERRFHRMPHTMLREQARVSESAVIRQHITREIARRQTAGHEPRSLPTVAIPPKSDQMLRCREMSLRANNDRSAVQQNAAYGAAVAKRQAVSSPAGKPQNQASLKLKSRQSGGLGRIAMLASPIALDILEKAMLLAGELYGGWRLQ
jgi:hypothetical protein